MTKQIVRELSAEKDGVPVLPMKDYKLTITTGDRRGAGTSNHTNSIQTINLICPCQIKLWLFHLNYWQLIQVQVWVFVCMVKVEILEKEWLMVNLKEAKKPVFSVQSVDLGKTHKDQNW